MKDNKQANVTIEMLPTKVLLVGSKDREILQRHVEFLEEVVKNFNGECVYKEDYADEVMLVFKFTEFECCEEFTVFAIASNQ